MKKRISSITAMILVIMILLCGCNFTEKNEKTEVPVHRMPTEEELQILEGCNLSSDYMKQIKEEGMSLTVQSFVDTARIMLDYLEQKYGEQFVVAGGSPADMWTSDFMIFAKATTGEHKGERFECYYKLDEDAGKRYCEDGYFALVEQPVMEQYFQQVAEESGCQFKVTVCLTGNVRKDWTKEISIEDIKELIREKELLLGLSCFASPNMTDEDFEQEANNLEQMLDDTGFSMQCSMMRLLSDDIFNEISTYQDFSNVCNRVNPAEDIWDLQYNASLNYNAK